MPSGTVFTDNAAVSPSLPDGTYTYQVRAADLGEANTGIVSAPVSITYDTTAPSAPSGVAATAALDGSIGITWNASSDGTGSGIARYVVRRSLSSTAAGDDRRRRRDLLGPRDFVQDATTLTGKLYSYAVFAVDAVGISSSAGVALGVTARDQLPPSVPTGLRATPGDASVALQWDAAGAEDDVAGYVLVAKPGSSAPVDEADGTRVCTAIIAGSTTCSATGLTNGATYTFGLFALDEALNRSQPAVVSAAPNGKVTDAKAPAAVTGLKAKVSGHTVTLTWKNPGRPDFDHVEITADERKPAAAQGRHARLLRLGHEGHRRRSPPASRAGSSSSPTTRVGNASAPASVHVSDRRREPVRARAAAPRCTARCSSAGRSSRVPSTTTSSSTPARSAILVSWPGGRASAAAQGQAQAWHDLHLVRLAGPRRKGQGALRQADRKEHLHVRRVSDPPLRPSRNGGFRGGWGA